MYDASRYPVLNICRVAFPPLCGLVGGVQKVRNSL